MSERSTSEVDSPNLDSGRTWGSAPGVVAIVLIGVWVLWRGRLLLQGWFTQDDFDLQTRAANAASPDWQLLSEPIAGHFSPPGQLLAWLEVSRWPLTWTPVALITLTIMAAAAVAMWHLLTEVLGDRWLRIPLLTAFCATPLTYWTTQWWALALVHVPAMLSMTVTLWATAVTVRRPSGWASGVMILSFVLGLLFDLRTAIVLLAVLALAVRLAGRGELTRRAPQWAAMGLAVLLGATLLAASSVRFVRPNDTADIGQSLSAYLRHLSAGLVGGPWGTDGAVDAVQSTQRWPGAIGVLVLLLVLGGAVRLGGRRALLPVCVLLVCLTLGASFLFLGAGQVNLTVGQVPRVAADMVPLSVALTAAAWSGVSVPLPAFLRSLRLGRVGGRLRRLPPQAWGLVTASVLTLALGVSGIATGQHISPRLANADDKEFVDNVRADLQDQPLAVLIDERPPEELMSGLFEDARLSTVLALVPERPIFDFPSSDLRLVRPNGRLRRVRLDDQVRMVPVSDEGCGYSISGRNTRIPMNRAVAPGAKVARIGYIAGEEGFLSMEQGGRTIRIPVQSGIGEIDLVIRGGFSEMRMRLENSEATLCLASLVVGTPIASR